MNSRIIFVSTFISFLTCCCFYCSLLSPVLAHGMLDEQIIEVTKLIEQDPNDASLYLKRGELHRHHHDWEKALVDYGKAASIDAHLAIVDLARGKMMLEAGWTNKARIALDRFLEHCPNQSEALILRARALVKLGKYLEAAEDFTNALSSLSNPEPEYYIERAQALSKAGTEYIDDALFGIDEGLRKLGQIVTLQLYAVDLELKLKNYESALTRLEQIASQSPRKDKWLLQRGEILQKAGRYDEAHKTFAKALKNIESLSHHRRKTKTIIELEKNLHAALNRQAGKEF
jgi:tetratricopeptide (TPR) repeat protein